jgi:hypothetical protein
MMAATICVGWVSGLPRNPPVKTLPAAKRPLAHNRCNALRFDCTLRLRDGVGNGA